MIRGIYLRCNGELACYCGPGEEVVLGNLPHHDSQYNFIKDFYKNDGHNFVRDCMTNNILPYPGICLKCIYLEPYLFPKEELIEKEIEWMHIEATSQCNLDCTFCIPLKDRKSFRKKPHYIPFEMYEKVINDIAAHGMSVKWMYFSGRGEPGLHKKIWSMVKLAKEQLDTDFLVNTNGNIPFSELIVDSGLDKIKIAIDGTDQHSYETYRRRGKLDKILRLTKSISDRKRALGIKTPKIIWQYILFTHNDSLEVLSKIQEMAQDLEVDEILFKTTFTHNYSTLDITSIPEVHSNIQLLDIKGMVVTSELEIGEKIAKINELKQTHDWEIILPYGIDISKNIFRRFILGIERKQIYNEYGKSDDLSGMIDFARSHDHEFKPLLGQLRHCFRMLAEAYKETNRHQYAVYYTNFDQKLEQAGVKLRAE